MAKKETGAFTSTDPEPQVASEPAAEAPAAAEPVAATVPPEDDLEFVAVEPEAVQEPARHGPAAGARGEAKGKVLVWAVAAAIVVALVAGAIAFRGEVIKLWPKSQAAYAGLGLPLNSLGLVIEGVHAEPSFLGGRPVLSVTGAIRNVKDEAVNSPAIRINLLNRAGMPIAAKIVRPLDPRVPAGATRHFAIAFSDPPANARDLEVVFETAPRQTAVTPAAVAPAAPVEAQPLAPGAADALPEHG
ncbi:MAG: hypothetical protein JWP73_1781 [Phenylobacterium sp.]|nr:hypothetical protein [Phenylobacterium sp.]